MAGSSVAHATQTMCIIVKLWLLVAYRVERLTRRFIYNQLTKCPPRGAIIVHGSRLDRHGTFSTWVDLSTCLAFRSLRTLAASLRLFTQTYQEAPVPHNDGQLDVMTGESLSAQDSCDSVKIYSRTTLRLAYTASALDLIHRQEV